MTNRHWYDDSNGERRGGMQGNQASLPVMIFFSGMITSNKSTSSFFIVTFYLFFSKYVKENGAVNCAALGPNCVKSVTAVHS